MSEDKITRDYMYPLFLKAASKMREEMKKEKAKEIGFEKEAYFFWVLYWECLTTIIYFAKT